MSLRIIVSIAASLTIAVACLVAGSTGTFARDAQMDRLHHKGGTHHSVNHGRSAHPGSMAKPAPAAK